MNTSQLECIIQCDPILHEKVAGVFAADRIPNVRINTNYGLIVNTDPHNKPGSHWVAIYGDGDGHTEFFDSYGKPPRENSNVVAQWIDKMAKTVIYNGVQIQSDKSAVCGLYCVLFLRYRLLGYNMEDFVNLFDPRNTTGNDLYVYRVTSVAYSHCKQCINAFNQMSYPYRMNSV